jgi:DNA repair protein SbcC/Rad50
MILKSITLKNFRKFKDSTVEFPDGVTGVVGLNGAGKSTLFEALAWALYGPVATRTGVDQLKREGATPSEACRVEIEFIFNDDTYRIVREMTGKNLSTSGIATVNGKLAVNGAEALSKFIQKKLGMDWKSFYTSIFAKQKELNTLSSMNPSERRQLILRMLGINAVDDIISKIRGDSKEKKNTIEKLQLDCIDESGNDKKTVYHQEIQTLEKKQKELTQRILEHKKQVLKIEEELQKTKKDNETKKQTYEKLYKTKEQLEEKKSRYEHKQHLENNIKTIEKTLQERQEHQKKQHEKLSLYKNLDNDLQTLEQQQQKNHDATQTIIKKQMQNTTIVNRLKKDINEITTKKHHIEKMGPSAKCPTCERVLGQQHSTLLKTYSEELTTKNNETIKLAEEATKLQTEYDRLSREKQALQKKNTYLRTQEMERERLQTSIRFNSEEIQRVKQEEEQKKKELKSLVMLQFDQKQYGLLRTQVNEAYLLYQTSLKKINTITEQHQKITISEKGQEGEKNLLVQQIKTFEKHIEDQKKLEQKLEDERVDAQRLNMLSEVMDSYRTYLISQIRPALSTHASELFTELTDGKYSQIELDEDYNLLVYDHGQPYSIERFSGGEEDLANLCIRLAISEIITERVGSVFQFIILDEIFGSQDQIRKQNIIKALNNFSSKFRQIFLITHVDDVKHFTEHTIQVLEDENRISSITIE